MYTQIYKKQVITISKFYIEHECRYYWGFSINGSDVQDYQLLKRTSLKWAKEIIDNLEREKLYGHSVKFI